MIIKLKKRQIISPFQFVPNINIGKCHKIKHSLKHIIRFKIHSKEELYKNLTKNFDYVNIQIIKNLNSY